MPTAQNHILRRPQNKNAGTVSLQAGVEYCCVVLEQSDHARIHTGLPSRLTRFREAVDAHAQEIICTKV
jgi:hypothetical protein